VALALFSSDCAVNSYCQSGICVTQIAINGDCSMATTPDEFLNGCKLQGVCDGSKCVQVFTGPVNTNCSASALICQPQLVCNTPALCTAAPTVSPFSCTDDIQCEVAEYTGTCLCDGNGNHFCEPIAPFPCVTAYNALLQCQNQNNCGNFLCEACEQPFICALLCVLEDTEPAGCGTIPCPGGSTTAHSAASSVTISISMIIAGLVAFLGL